MIKIEKAFTASAQRHREKFEIIREFAAISFRVFCG